MGTKLGRMTLKSLFSKPETVQYPFETKPVPRGLKGHIENDMDVCVLCGICYRTCPAAAITVDRAAGTWTINPFRCVQCKSCTRACPKHCLVMKPGYQKPSREMNIIVLSKNKDMDKNIQVGD